MPGDIVIFGCGGYARGVAEAAEAQGAWRVQAFIGQDVPDGASVMGRRVIDETLWQASDVPRVGVVAIGDNWQRQQVVERTKKAVPGFEFCRVIHPRAIVSPSAELGVGVVILAGSVVGAAARLGEHVSIYTNAVVEHDSVLSDFSSLAPAAALGGTVMLGIRSFVGLGASVAHGIRIGDDVIVGAGSVLVQECPPRSVVAGNPARVIATRKPGEIYL